MRTLLLTLVATIAVAAASISAGPARQAAQPPRPPASGQPAVTFKVEINYVELDAVVTDAQGKFVDNLSRDDFQVTENGTRQNITAFTRVDLPVQRLDPPLYKSAPVEPDVRSNREQFNGRVFVLLLDDLQTDARRTPVVRAAAKQFIRRYVGANDMVAIVQTGGGAREAQDFTSSQPRLLAAIDKFVGRKLPSATLTMIDDYYSNLMMAGGGGGTMGSGGVSANGRDTNEMERRTRARNSLLALKNLADYLGGVHGRRKAIVWFGEGIDYDVESPVSARGGDFTTRDPSVLRDATREAIAAANRADVSFYSVDPRGLGAGLEDMLDIGSVPVLLDQASDSNQALTSPLKSLMNEVRLAHESMSNLSNQTGGFAVINENNLNNAFERVVRENSTYYVLGYYSTNEKRDGKFRSVDVKVTRPGLSVRARKGYVAASGKPPASNGAAAEMPADLRDAFNSPIPASGLGLSVFAAPFSGGAKASVGVIVEFDPGKLKFVEKDGVYTEDVELHIVALNVAGKMQDGGKDAAPLRLSPPSYEAVSQHGVRFTRRLQLPPGRYQLRVGAREANGGAIGTLSYDLDVPDFSKEPLAISGIAVASAFASRMPTANPDPAFKDVLPSSPTALRDFPTNDTLALFADVYDNQPSTPHRVAIDARVVADDGRVVFTAADERRSEELGAKGGGYGYTVTIPLKGWAPGRYVLRVEARSLLSGGPTVARELEFRIR